LGSDGERLLSLLRSCKSKPETHPTDFTWELFRVNSIQVQKLHELYIDTARQCFSGLTTLSDEEIEHRLFEEFDVGVHSFFHDDNLKELLKAGLIGQEAVLLSREIRKTWIELENTNWTIGEIKTHSRWARFFSLCDQLLADLDEAIIDPDQS